MCFVINKDYAGEIKMKSMRNEFIEVGYQKSSPAEIADHVAVHESGVKSVVKTGQRVGTGGNSQDPANIRRKS